MAKYIYRYRDNGTIFDGVEILNTRNDVAYNLYNRNNLTVFVDTLEANVNGVIDPNNPVISSIVGGVQLSTDVDNRDVQSIESVGGTNSVRRSRTPQPASNSEFFFGNSRYNITLDNYILAGQDGRGLLFENSSDELVIERDSETKTYIPPVFNFTLNTTGPYINTTSNNTNDAFEVVGWYIIQDGTAQLITGSEGKSTFRTSLNTGTLVGGTIRYAVAFRSPLVRIFLPNDPNLQVISPEVDIVDRYVSDITSDPVPSIAVPPDTPVTLRYNSDIIRQRANSVTYFDRWSVRERTTVSDPGGIYENYTYGRASSLESVFDNVDSKTKQITIAPEDYLIFGIRSTTDTPEDPPSSGIEPSPPKPPVGRSERTAYELVVNVLPEPTPSEELVVEYPVTLNLLPVSINITEPLKKSAFDFLRSILNTYIDEDRDLKTLLNFGDDTQDLILSYRSGSVNNSGVRSLQLKVLRPIPENIGLNDPVFISRELANTVIDKVRIRSAPEIDSTPYLRPRNTDVETNVHLGKSLKNVTLNLLSLQTGSLGGFDSSKNISFEDSIFRQWYSYDFDSSELNIDFSDYSNFVFYGSATMRLAAFREKLRRIESLTTLISQFSGSVFTGSFDSAGSSFVLNTSAEYSKEKEDIIRSFDRYEQYLFFTPSGSNNSYSGSLWYDVDWYDYNPVGYWPKNESGSLYSITSSIAQDWYATQSAIAQRFDEGNENNLINTVPTHIREHEDNAPYFTFIAMVGHFFDTIKPYVDQFSNIHSRYIDPNEELSKDLVYNIAESVGFELPAINSVYDLSETILGTADAAPRRDFTIEAHKRLLHNLPYFIKTKGTKTAIETALHTLGITDEILDVRETGIANTGSFYVFDENYTGINFVSSSTTMSVEIPISASVRTPYPRSFQLNTTLDGAQEATIVTGDDLWAINVTQHPTITSLGRIELVSGSSQSVILSSSYQELFTNDPINITLNTYTDTLSSELKVIQTNRDDVIFNVSASEASASNKFISLWNSTNNLYIGGSGSLKNDSLNGLLDEFRLWGTNLSDRAILEAAYDPGTNGGDVYTDPTNFLYVQLSFNKINTGSLLDSSSLDNETPYIGISISPSLENISVTGITTESFSRRSRSIKQPVVNTGATSYVSNKVTIAPEPVFTYKSLSGKGVKTLSRTESIVDISQKSKRNGRNKVIVATSPTKVVNDNIIRNLGATNVNSLLGVPNDSYVELTNTFQDLRDHYTQYYYVNVDINRYIRIMASVNSIIDQFIEYFIPSKASVIKGILIEPTVLERIKVRPVRRIRAYGSKTRKTNNAAASLTGSGVSDYEGTFNLSKTIDLTDAETAIGSYSTYKGQLSGSTVNSPVASAVNVLGNTNTGLTGRIANQSISQSSQFVTYTSQSNIPQVDRNILGEYKVYDLQHLDWPEFLFVSNSRVPGTDEYVSSSYAPHRKQVLDLQLDDVNKFTFNATRRGSEGAEPYNRVYTRKLFDYEIDLPRDGGITSLNRSALYEIPPYSDLRDYGVSNYFINPYGVYYFPETILARVSRIDPLLQEWDGEQFIGAVTWSYGGSYVKDQVVYQNLSIGSEDAQNFTDSQLKLAIRGNGKYYALKTSIYSGSLTTYLPPSIDGGNWERLKFVPQTVQVPKRIIFDTFTIPDPKLNNYKVTNVSIDRAVDVPGRFIDEFNIGSLAPGEVAQGNITIQNILTLFAIQSNRNNIRIRLYRTITDMQEDISRSVSTQPTSDAGVLLDALINNRNEIQLITPFTTLVSGEIPLTGNIYYTVDNLDTTTKSNITLLLYYFSIENESRVPVGYLRKHYRFFRDNSTATKRRNYLGCKNVGATETSPATTIDGEDPVEIFIGEGSEVSVPINTPRRDLRTGGQGVLDVS